MFKNKKIKKKLNMAFILVTSIASIAGIIGFIAMIYVSERYTYALKNYGFSQGDIGKTMVAFSEVRSATRAIIGYTDPDVIEIALNAHEKQKDSFTTNMKKIEKTLNTQEEKNIYEEISKDLETYWKLDTEIVELGNTTDEERSKQAQAKAAEELSEIYEEIYSHLEELMDINVNTGNELDSFLSKMVVGLTVLIIGVIIIILIISINLGNRIAKGIAVPIEALSKRLELFSKGNLSDPFPTTDSKDEVAEMISTAQNMANNLRILIHDSGNFMQTMAEGDYTSKIQFPDKYVGEFSQLKENMEETRLQVNQTLKQIDDASNQVAVGSNNMAQVAQNLAEGATEQAGAVEELQATIANITEGVQTTANNTKEAYQVAEDYAKEADRSREEMHEMVNAMARINETSQKIGAIISEIEEIASQTNLLSLNASIEAARAGEAGKGFAVVADQIGKLADQSAQSAVDTRRLIESTIQQIQEGNGSAEKTAASLEDVVKGIKILANSSKELSKLSEQQAQTMEQAEIGVNQISEIIQVNSATAQETSATSEELSAQAEALDELIGKFQLEK